MKTPATDGATANRSLGDHFWTIRSKPRDMPVVAAEELADETSRSGRPGDGADLAVRRPP